MVSAVQSGHNSLAILFLPFFVFSSSKVARSPDDRVQVEADHLLARGLHLQEGRRRDGDVHRVLRGGPGEHLCFCDSVLSLDKVVGGPNDSIIFVTLGPGVCFGEIALLGTGGMNRRTASIKVNIQMQNLSSDF